VAALFHSTPLLVKSARAAFESVDRSYERAARNLGATELRLFWRVTLPLTRRAILAAAALGFARSLGDFGVTLMIAGNIPGRTQTVALAIYDAVEAGNGQTARVLVIIISAIALIVLSVANRLTSSPYGPRQTAL
jgi:molybdate transport system permease protein